jgi:hypothetical protein
MERKRYSVLSLLAGIFLLAGLQFAAEESSYGYISFVDNGAAILRADGSQDQAVVNLPLVPGDTVVTPSGGRCELQFDNGTVVRLDKDSRLRLTTVLAPSLTSNWEITTLDLLQGQLYALPQTYNREMFQVVTPNAAVHLKSRTAAYIRLDAGGGTSFFSDGGKFMLLYGARSLKKAKVNPGRPLAVTATHGLAEPFEKKDIEFTAWNEYVDRHFKELHFGISKVPANLTKFKNKALLLWAEKWSSLVGEWIYDELFGYVWRPADEQFAFSQRPFFHADFVRINGRLFLVPQEQWGWVPAHMGTWVWLKRGWSWIPGDWFHPGIVDFQDTWAFPTLGYYYTMFVRSQAPPDAERIWPGRSPRKPLPPRLPGPVIDIVKKMIKPPDADKRRVIDRVVPTIDGRALAPAPRLPTPVPGGAARKGPVPAAGSESPLRVPYAGITRDWNPDARWAEKRGVRVGYSSSDNSVVCPALKISSNRITGFMRMMLRDEASRQSPAVVAGGTTAPPPSGSFAISAGEEAAGVKTTASGERARTDDGKER